MFFSLLLRWAFALMTCSSHSDHGLQPTFRLLHSLMTESLLRVQTISSECTPEYASELGSYCDPCHAFLSLTCHCCSVDLLISYSDASHQLLCVLFMYADRDLVQALRYKSMFAHSFIHHSSALVQLCSNQFCSYCNLPVLIPSPF